jgi:hypothetical protein
MNSLAFLFNSPIVSSLPTSMNRDEQHEELSTGEMDDQNDEGIEAPPLPAEFTQLLGEWCQASDAHGLAHYQWKTLAETNAIAQAHSIQVSGDASSREGTLRIEAMSKLRALQEEQTKIEAWIQTADGDRKVYAELMASISEEMTILILARCAAQDRVDEAYEKLRQCEVEFRPQSSADMIENDHDYQTKKEAYDSALRARVSVGARMTACTEQAAAGRAPTTADAVLRELAAADCSRIPKVGSPFYPMRALPTLADKVFSGGLIASLQWPNGAPQAMLLTRIDVKALRPGMVLPVLRFKTTTDPAFDDRDTPA